MRNLVMRRKLAQDLRQLVAGTITNDDFDDAYYRDYCESDDPTIRKVAQFGWSLYSDNRKYRLRGRDAVNAETRSSAVRCVLLLRAGTEYEWPATPRQIVREFADAFVLLGVAAGAAATIVWSMLLIAKTKDVEFVTPLGIAGITLLACSLWYMRGGMRKSRDTPAWRQWRASGDFDVWPFLRRADFEAAREIPKARLIATIT